MNKPAFLSLILGVLLLSQGGLEAQDKDNPPKDKEKPKVKLIEGKPLEFWLAALKSDKAEVRQGAARVLAKARGDAKGAVPAALEMLKGENNYDRALAAYLLQYLEGDPKTVVPALVAALGDKDRKVRETVAFGLANVKGDDGADALAAATKQMAEHLKSEIADVRGLTLYVLGNARKVESKNITEPILEVVKTDKVPAVKKAALEALRNTSMGMGKATLPVLFETLKDKDPDVRRAAAGTLIVFKVDTREKENVAILKELMLKGESADVRGLAAFILGNIQPDKKEISDALLQAIKQEKIPAVVTQIRAALIEIDPLRAKDEGIE